MKTTTFATSDYVGTFRPSKLEKDPNVWSYGMDYTSCVRRESLCEPASTRAFA